MTGHYTNLEPLVDADRGIAHVVVETPAGSQNKYDYDPVSGLFLLDRPIHSSLRYPCDYGFVPNTLALDGDPVDAVLLLQQPSFPGCVVLARVLAVMDMRDEHGRDEKVICVADSDPRARHLHDLGDLPESLAAELRHFFVHIKDLEEGKWAEVEGFRGRVDAIRAIEIGRGHARRSG